MLQSKLYFHAPIPDQVDFTTIWAIRRRSRILSTPDPVLISILEPTDLSRTGYIPSGGGLIGRSARDAATPSADSKFLETPTAWWSWAETRYDTPLVLHYDRLDPASRYRLRIVRCDGKDRPSISTCRK